MIISKWFGSDPNGSVLKAEMDVQPGGKFKISFSNQDGTEHTCYGTYQEVRPFDALSFTWTWKAEPGVESRVTVLLSSESDNSTRMQFEHAHVGHESAHSYQQGWESTFLKLARVLGSEK